MSGVEKGFVFDQEPKETSSETDHEFPPDAFFRRYFPFSFTQAFVALAIIATVVDFVRVGNPNTGIPYNYPLLAGLVYIVAVLFILRRYHRIFDETKGELVDVLERSEAARVVFERDSDLSPRQVAQEIDAVMDWAFHPFVILGGGLIGGVFALAVMWRLAVFDAYPYLLMNYAYGAGHGFFYGPIAGSVYLIVKITRSYIVDIDILAPDHVGGYKKIGEAIVSLVVYGIFLVTLDFVILSSVSFIDRPLFQVAVFALYVLMLLFLLAVTVIGIYSLRRRLLSIREARMTELREQFKDIEARYWQKLQRDESPQPEADHIQTMTTMFQQLDSMELWPINPPTFVKLAASTGGSVLVAAYQGNIIEIPVEIAIRIPFEVPDLLLLLVSL